MPIETRNISSDRSSFDPEDNVQGNKSNINSENTFKSSSAEVRPDEVTTSKRDLLEPKKGEVIFNIDSEVNEEWNGTEWISCSGNSGNISKQGFIDYNDTTGSTSLTEDVWTDIPNNGLGAFTNKTYKPTSVVDVLDGSTGYLDFSDLTLGSQLLIRNDFTVTPNTNNSLLEVRYLLGQGAGEYALKFWSERLDSGSGIGYQRVVSFPIYMGDTNTQGGVGRLQVKLSTNGSINNAGSYIKIDLR